MIVAENDLRKVRALAWNLAFANHCERKNGGRGSSIFDNVANTLRDLADEIEVLRKPHVIDPPHVRLVPRGTS